MVICDRQASEAVVLNYEQPHLPVRLQEVKCYNHNHKKFNKSKIIQLIKHF